MPIEPVDNKYYDFEVKSKVSLLKNGRNTFSGVM